MENVTRWGMYTIDSIVVSNAIRETLDQENNWILNTELEEKVTETKVLNYVAEDSRIFVYDNALNYLIFHDQVDVKFDHENEKVFYKLSYLELNDH